MRPKNLKRTSRRNKRAVETNLSRSRDELYALRSTLLRTRPETSEELADWCEEFFNFRPTSEHVCDDHNSQMDYLNWATHGNGDCFVVGCRGSGKTRLGGITTIYDSLFRHPCSTIIIGGCVHPTTPILTERGFVPASQVSIGDKIFTGKSWSIVLSKSFAPPKPAKIVYLRQLPPLIASEDHPVLAVSRVYCIKSKYLPWFLPYRVCTKGRVCHSASVNKCKGHGDVRFKTVKELQEGDAILYPLSYLQGGDKEPDIKIANKRVSPYLLGLLFGSRSYIRNGEIQFRRRFSSSREIDLFTINALRDAIGHELGFSPWSQRSIGDSFELGYDARLFEGYNISHSLPLGIFDWCKSARNEFTKGALSGTLCNFPKPHFNSAAYRTSRCRMFAINLYSLLADNPPQVDDYEGRTRLVYAKRGALLHDRLPKRVIFEEMKTQPKTVFINTREFGRSLAVSVMKVEPYPGDSQGFIDFEVADIHQFQTMFGVVHNSERQSLRMYSYIKPILGSSLMEEIVASAPLREKTEFINGNSIEIIPSTELAAQGFHQQRIKIDELDDIKQGVWDTIQFDIDGASILNPQVEGFGTFHKVDGTYGRVLAKARSKGIKIFKICLLDILEPCKNRLCSNCDLSDCCGGIAKEKKSGFFKIDRAINIRSRILSQQEWKVKMLLEEPRALDNVIPDFQDKYPFVVRTPYNRALPTYRFFDWGGTGNFFVIWAQLDKENRPRIRIIAELTEPRGISPSSCAKDVLRFEASHGITNILASYGDPSGASWISEFAVYGIYVLGLSFPKQHRLNVLNRLFTVIDGKPDIVIDPSCKELRKQLLSYDIRAFQNLKGGPRDDGVDALLYGVGSMHLKLRLKDDNPPGVYSIKRDQNIIQKFSPAVEEILNVRNGKTDYRQIF